LSLESWQPGIFSTPKGSGSSAPSDTQWKNNPCRQPDDMSQSVDVSDIIMRTTTKTPHINAMTFNGLVMVIVSIVVVGAMAEGDGCRSLLIGLKVE
jgi:hypothetical protein